MADAGLASRRASELLIEEGRVRVNGEIVRTMPVMVDPIEDRIEVDGKPIPKAERHVYIMLNKPSRTISSARDEPGAVRRTVLDLVDHPSRARLYPVGRLDFDTTGMVLLTNDGELANRLTHPRFGVEKTYHVVVKGMLDDQRVAELERGIYIAERREGRTVGGSRASHVGLTIIRRDRERTILELTLKEGRNRQVRRMLAGVGAPVKKLERVAIGPVHLRKLARGEWRELTAGELGALRKACRGASAAKPVAAGETAKPRRAVPQRPVRAAKGFGAGGSHPGARKPGSAGDARSRPSKRPTRPGMGRPGAGRPGANRSSTDRRGGTGRGGGPRGSGGQGGGRGGSQGGDRGGNRGGRS